MGSTKTIEVKENGNIVFSYLPIKYKDTIFQRLIIPELCYIAISLIVILLVPQNTRFVLLVGLLILFVLLSVNLIYRWMRYTENLNNKAEKNIIDEVLKDVIKADVSSFGVNIIELERKLHIDTGEYGELKGKSLMIILSNGVEIKYDIRLINRYNKILVQEINTHFQRI